jgi:hypothetical protein
MFPVLFFFFADGQAVIAKTGLNVICKDRGLKMYAVERKIMALKGSEHINPLKAKRICFI